MVNLLYNVRDLSEPELSVEQQEKFATLRGEIAVGIEQAEHRDFKEFNADEIIAEGRERRAASVAG